MSNEQQSSRRRNTDNCKMDPARLQEIASNLTAYDRVRVNTRDAPLTVKYSTATRINPEFRQLHGVKAYRETVALGGYGTEYHIVWQHGSMNRPRIYRESEWTTVGSDGESHTIYEGDGEWVNSLEIISKSEKTIGDQIREWREEKGWSQRTLAEKAGIPQSTVSRCERGKISLDPSTIESLENAMKTDSHQELDDE